jgi:cytochrome P450
VADARPFSQIPGPRGLPVVGMAPAFLADPFAYVESLRPWGPVVRVQVGPRQIVYLMAPELIGEVLLHRARAHVKGRFFERAQILFGLGLVTSEGELWRRQRALMAPAFHPRAVAGFSAAMASLIDARIGAWAPGPHEVDAEMNALTLDLALAMLFGTSAGDDGPTIARAFTDMSRFFSSVEEMVAPTPMWLPTPGHRRFQRAFDALERVVARIVAERRARGPGAEPDLLDRLLEARDEQGSPMSDAQLFDEVRTLVLAAHETTAIALALTLHLLATHPDAQARAAAEAAGPAGAPQPWIEACLSEGMRLYPPVPIIFREPTADEVLGGYQIPAGTTLGLPAWGVQRDPAIFEDPGAFRPERWLPPAEPPHRFAYFPFGGGPRVCVGAAMATAEARMVLAAVLRRFEVRTLPDTELKLFPGITLRTTSPLRLDLRPR